MPLTSGTRIGVFEVVALLGEGGMGQVYRARDTRLDRDVALKVLPELFTSDPERLARFEREAKVLASLNHPNIAQVYGFESSSAAAGHGSAIAMELVDGPTLGELIDAGLAFERALPIARQIAAALEAAHDQGIIHRDLKPANVKVRDDHAVKVLDFGLAKAFAADAESAASGVSNSPTLTARSQIGMILGTAAYMAPEQAKGRAVDRRADVWAFGVVFYEMLAGRRAFEGDDVSEVLASVLKTEPDWNALPADVPAPVRRLLRRCLEKDPKKRLRDVAEGMLQLDEAMAAGAPATSSGFAAAGSGAAGAMAPAPPRPLWRRAAPIVVTAVTTAAVMAGVAVLTREAPAAPVTVRFQHVPDPAVPLFNTAGMRDFAISPDGRRLVYTVAHPVNLPRPALYMRALDQQGAVPLRGADVAIAPFFSPDSEWVGFLDQQDQTQLKKVSALGGPAVPVVKAASTILGATWMADGQIVFGRGNGSLSRVPEGGGPATDVTALEFEQGEASHVWPSAVPGTSVVLFTTLGSKPPHLAAVDLSTGRVVRLNIPGGSPRYLPTGHLVYATTDGALHAVRFDPETMAVTGNPAPVLEGVGTKPSGAAAFDVSRSGHLVHSAGGTTRAARTLTWVDRAGKETPISAAPARNYFYARISPDGSRLSLDVRDEEEDIWIWDLKRDTIARLTDKAGADQYGLWAPDHRLIFTSVVSGRTEIFRHRPDAVGQPERITDTTAGKLVPFPNAVTPDGTQVIFRSATGATKNDLWAVNLEGDRTARKLLSTEHDERNPSLSPDGKYMAFESDMSGGRIEVFIRPFPNVDGGQWKVSVAGGEEPVWSPTGREIFYLADGRLTSVPVTMTSQGPELGRPTPLFPVSAYFFGGIGRNYDVTRDGQRFVMVRNPEMQGSNSPISVVLHWLDELRERLK
jgi:predicted Ser/Thr protein kinase